MGNRNIIKSIFISLLFYNFSFPASSADVDTLFMSDKIIRIELRADFSAILEDRGENPGYHEAELIYRSEDRKIINLPVKLLVRGNFRRNPVYCNFPPLLVNFRKGDVVNTVFQNQDKLKIVTPCQSDEAVIAEYKIYKMYNKVTDLSLKVRLVKIAYIDTGTDKMLFNSFSFFIEDKDHAAERNNAFVKDEFMTPFDIDRDNFKKMSVFQYIIGNIDWYVSSRKNIIIMQPNDTALAPSVVPYDFDFSAFVNADYTKNRKAAGLFPAQRRSYKGLCYSDKEYEEVFDFYRKLRPDFNSIIRRQGTLSPELTSQITDFINQFYSDVEESKNIIKEFNSKCDTRQNYNIPEY